MENKEEKQKIPNRWIDCQLETDYFGEERKEGKKLRKIKKAIDRSKFKKTDQDQKEKNKKNIPLHEEKGKIIRGQVLSILSQGIKVDIGGSVLLCQLRGTLKQEKLRVKNLVTTGDYVLIQERGGEEGVIVSVEPRKSVLSRSDNLSRNKEQLIAANIDQVIITASILSPPLKPNLIDRYIIATLKGKMSPLIVINKIDLLEEFSSSEEREGFEQLLEEVIKAYKKASIEVICCSVKNNSGIERLCAAMKDKSSVFSGQSGTGKSSLINIVSGLNQRVGSVVSRTGKGSHTTTTAQLLPLPFGGRCIDTPGIQSFGVWEVSAGEIESYFVEIHALAKRCHFPNCSHRHEQDCAVLQALDKQKLSPLRYWSYVSLLESVLETHKRR